MTDTPTPHASDDDLVLFFYRELPPDAHARLSTHLDDCPVCRDTFETMTRTLELAGRAETPDPGPDFEDRLWARIAPAVTTHRTSPRRWPSILAWAATLLVAGGLGWWWTNRPAPVTPEEMAVVAPAAGDPREHVLLAALDAHLVQTEMVFVELMNAPVTEPDAFDAVRTTADDLVASGRLYRETARDTGASQLVAVLDELEPVLIEVARSGAAATPNDLRALRGRIEQDDLLFKVRAVAADIQDRQEGAPFTEGAL